MKVYDFMDGKPLFNLPRYAPSFDYIFVEDGAIYGVDSPDNDLAFSYDLYLIDEDYNVLADGRDTYDWPKFYKLGWKKEELHQGCKDSWKTSLLPLYGEERYSFIKEIYEKNKEEVDTFFKEFYGVDVTNTKSDLIRVKSTDFLTYIIDMMDEDTLCNYLSDGDVIDNLCKYFMDKQNQEINLSEHDRDMLEQDFSSLEEISQWEDNWQKTHSSSARVSLSSMAKESRSASSSLSNQEKDASSLNEPQK
ncbi:hypothetical protein AB1I62_03995 [Enterococcus sp. AN402]|uniref:hypothetical protein n=1 Tax=Enterococcus sp. AN402 TaxID=3151386 RepID=UPI00345A5E03